jgi:hypothetical protein
MRIHTVGVAIVGLTALLAGCSEDAAPAPQPTTSSPAATASAADEQQIRDVMTQVTDATNAWDGPKVAGLTCAKYRDQASSFSDVVPPMDIFASARDAAAEMGPDQFAQLIGQQFTGATPESLLAVANAVINNDQAAYQTSMFEVMKQVSKFRLDKIDNIVVNGDNATADATISFTIGSEPPQSQQTEVKLAREDGQWKDCTPPGE